jgi:hypothetical protein
MVGAFSSSARTGDWSTITPRSRATMPTSGWIE